jgi:hypothetical protein
MAKATTHCRASDPVKIAYLVLAHNTPNHLRRLIAALSTGSSGFFIHIDEKSDIGDFSGIGGGNVCFIRERIPVYWGDFSQVEAILILLQAALADPGHFERLVLVSGADYPLCSSAYMERFFSDNPDREFMNLIAMSLETPGKPISRLTTYKPRIGEDTGDLPGERDYKAYLGDLVPYGGATWWAISRAAADFIVAFAEREIRVVNFFKNTICPDESFFQTVLGNSPFKARTIRNLTYADWSAGGPNPAYITDRHLALFRTTGVFAPNGRLGGGEMLFARKFPDDSEDLVAKLAEQVWTRRDAAMTGRS